MDPTKRKTKIEVTLRDNIIAGGFSVAISSNDTPPNEFCVGHADIAQQELIDSTHLFGIGSITKVFIAVILLQLIEEGKLKLTNTAEQYLSNEILHDIDNAPTATIEQLLGHTAGIDSWEDDPKWIVDGRGANMNISRIWGKTDTLEYIRRPKMTAPNPGEWYYSNTNYTLLGLIIEKVTQNTAKAEVRRRILEPLDMKETFFDGFESPPTGKTVAGRYHHATPQFRQTAGTHSSFPEVSPDIISATGSNLSVSWAAGGMISSAPDLIKFGTALRDGHLLTPSSMKVLQDWKSTTLPGHEIGHGLFRMTLEEKGTWIGHSGGVLGFSSGLWWKEDSDCIIAILANLGTVHAGKISKGVNGVLKKSDFLNLVSNTLSRTFHTPRLRIRLADPEDEEESKKILKFYDPLTRPDMQTPSDIRKKCEVNGINPDLCSIAVPPKGCFHLVYTSDPPNTEPIGFIGMSHRPGWPFPDIGYNLLPSAQGKGYAVEAAKAVLEFWRDRVGVQEIFALIGEGNVTSQRVAERIGFVRDGSTFGREVGGKEMEEGEVAFVLPGMEGRVDWEKIVLE